MTTKNLNYLNIVILIGVYFVNFLAGSGKLGVSMADLSKIFDFKYMPPGYVFGIAWSSIFVLCGFWLYELFKKNDKTGSLIFAIVGILNILWALSTSSQNYILATVAIFGMMYVLYLGLEHYKNSDSVGQKTVGIYYGWISVAAVVLGIAQIVFLKDPNLTKSTIFTIFVMILGICVTYFSYQKNKNIWAVIFSCIGLGGAVLGLLTR